MGPSEASQLLESFGLVCLRLTYLFVIIEMEKTTFGMELYLLMAYGTWCKCELVLLTLSRGFIPKIALVKSCSVAQNVSSCYSVSREHILSAQRWVSVLCKIYCRTPGHYLTLDLLCISKASLLLKYKDI